MSSPNAEAYSRASDYLDTWSVGTATRVGLIRCPACGADLTDEDGRRVEGQHVTQHIADHDPTDFGLSPLRGDADE